MNDGSIDGKRRRLGVGETEIWVLTSHGEDKFSLNDFNHNLAACIAASSAGKTASSGGFLNSHSIS